jgi:hypothetical protein
MSAAPSPSQMSTLKSIAHRKGVSFTYPKTRAQASAEIQRLMAIKGNGQTFAELNSNNRTAAKLERTVRCAAQVRDFEIDGYGSSATWR